MQYIILDLEWNQPLNYQNRAYRLYGDRLMFEMLQIGAVRINEQLEILDSISIPIRPTCYTVVHPRIRRMTHLTQEVLDDAPDFQDAIDQFVRWCGQDYVLLTWGCDDVSVLQQNLDFFDCHPDLPTLYDIQPLFSAVHHLANRSGLKQAMEISEINPDENRSFHDALNDAYYTALVFTHLPEPGLVLNYPQSPKPLIHPRPHATKGDLFESIAQALASEQAQKPRCAICARETILEDAYIPQAADKYVSLARCPRHGLNMVRLRFHPTMDHMREMTVRTTRATRPNIAYVHTKRLQIQQRAAEGRLPDPERMLEYADRSSVTFED